jgi:hypothetical protein
LTGTDFALAIDRSATVDGLAITAMNELGVRTDVLAAYGRATGEGLSADGAAQLLRLQAADGLGVEGELLPGLEHCIAFLATLDHRDLE